MKTERKPVREIRRGFVVAKIWFNPTRGKRGWHSVSISRMRYRDQYVQATGSFEYEDLKDVRKVARCAKFWIWLRLFFRGRNHYWT